VSQGSPQAVARLRLSLPWARIPVRGAGPKPRNGPGNGHGRPPRFPSGRGLG